MQVNYGNYLQSLFCFFKIISNLATENKYYDNQRINKS